MNGPYALTAFVRKLIADTTDAHSNTLRQIGLYAREFRAAAEARAIDIAASSHYRPPLPPALKIATERMLDLFNTLSFSAAYDAWQNDRMDKLAATLAADESFRATVDNWKNATAEDLLTAARFISKAQQTIFCEGLPVAMPKMHVTRLPVRDPNGGLHQPPLEETGIHRLSFRIDEKSCLRKATEGIETIFHENLHMTQTVLGFAFARGAMAGHPLEHDARLHLMIAVDQSLYFNGVASLYYAHPAERDAWDKSPAFVTKLRDALKPYGAAL